MGGGFDRISGHLSSKIQNRMTPRICNFYVTLQCNASCEFCQVWNNLEYQKIRESGNQISEILAGLKRDGIRDLRVTGGEPLLREDLPEIMRSAKELGFKIELTTNGILYAEKARALNKIFDKIYFSLDYPVAADHDRSRGTECFHLVMQNLKLAQELGEKVTINYTLTRDSVRFLPEMVDLANKLKVGINLNPVYAFFGTQGFDKNTFSYIRYFAKGKKVFLNLAMFDFLRSGGNRVYLPRCRASETVITLLPDGSRVSPCFYNPKGKQGREDICSSCMRWPYMLPSFTHGFDKYFWLNLYSESMKRRKGL